MFDQISNTDMSEQHMHSTSTLQRQLKQRQKYNLMGSRIPIQFVPEQHDGTSGIKLQGQWV